MPRAPICSGTTTDISPIISGSAKRIRLVTPNAESSRSKITGWISVFSGIISCSRIIRNSAIAAVAKRRAVAMYIRPTALCSALVTRVIQAFCSRGTCSLTTSGCDAVRTGVTSSRTSLPARCRTGRGPGRPRGLA